MNFLGWVRDQLDVPAALAAAGPVLVAAGQAAASTAAAADWVRDRTVTQRFLDGLRAFAATDHGPFGPSFARWVYRPAVGFLLQQYAQALPPPTEAEMSDPRFARSRFGAHWASLSPAEREAVRQRYQAVVSAPSYTEAYRRNFEGPGGQLAELVPLLWTSALGSQPKSIEPVVDDLRRYVRRRRMARELLRRLETYGSR
jgi:hypothetical protein